MREKSYATCMECGSEARQVKLEVKPMSRERVVQYECGAILRSVSVPSRQGRDVSVSSKGCEAGEKPASSVCVNSGDQPLKVLSAIIPDRPYRATHR